MKVSVARQYGTAGTGKVVAKVGTKTVGTGQLSAGKATLKLAKLNKGNAKVVVRYVGNATTAGSLATVTFKVVK